MPFSPGWLCFSRPKNPLFCFSLSSMKEGKKHTTLRLIFLLLFFLEKKNICEKSFWVKERTSKTLVCWLRKCFKIFIMAKNQQLGNVNFRVKMFWYMNFHGNKKLASNFSLKWFSLCNFNFVIYWSLNFYYYFEIHNHLVPIWEKYKIFNPYKY